MAPPRITILAVFAPGRRGPPADRVTNLVSPPARAWGGQGTDGVSKVCYPFTSRCKTWIDFASQSLNDHAVRRGSMTTEIQAEANRRNALHLAPIVLWQPGPNCPRRSAPASWRWLSGLGERWVVSSLSEETGCRGRPNSTRRIVGHSMDREVLLIFRECERTGVRGYHHG